MCRNIEVNGKTIKCQGELKDALGGNFVREKGYAENAYTDDMCLCPVDIVKTAEKYGYDLTIDEYGYIFLNDPK